MICAVYYDGIKTYTSSKGNPYADVFYREMQEDGNPDFEQARVRTFDAGVIAVCKTLKPNDCINLDLTIKDATLNAISQS